MTAQGPPRSFDEDAIRTHYLTLKAEQHNRDMWGPDVFAVECARWQWERDQAEIAQLKRKAEELYAALEEAWHAIDWQEYDERIGTGMRAERALRRWRGSGEK